MFVGEEALAKALTEAAEILSPQAEHVAACLAGRFGSVRNALCAQESELLTQGQLPEPLAFLLSHVGQLSRYMLGEQAKAAPLLRLSDVRTPLHGLYLGMPYECGYLLCLNEKGYLCRAAAIRMGSVGDAPFYPRIIIEEALRSGCETFLLAHNHPDGSPVPSADDAAATYPVLLSLHELGYTLLDHVVYAHNRVVSLRGTLPDRAWSLLSPLKEPYTHWLS